MPDRKPPRIVVAGAGIAGSLIASGLGGREDVEVICLEKVGADDHLDAGTGLNIGPNAIKALKAAMPERAKAIVDNSLAWRRWTIALTNGRMLMDLNLADVADNAGIRIRWAELYALLRKPLGGTIRYGAELLSCGRDVDGLFAVYRDGATAARDEDRRNRSSCRRRWPLFPDSQPLPGERGAALPGRLPLSRPVSRRRRLPDRGLWPVVQRPEPASRLPRSRRFRLLRRLLPDRERRRQRRDEDAGVPAARLYARKRRPLPRGGLSGARDRARCRPHSLGAPSGRRRPVRRRRRRAPGRRFRASHGADARSGRDPGGRGCLRRRR